MLRKYISYLGVIVLACFSFYYTDRASDIIKRNDPVMKNILTNKDNYITESVSATINNDEIIPGINGIVVNVNKSYQNMKKYNSYNESMYVFEEISPNISFIDQYDKYIVSGNSLKNQIALVFKVNDSSYIEMISNILLDKNVVASFFIDGNIIENNLESVLELANNKNEIENLGYDGNYSLEMFGWTNNLISSITKKDPKFCYTDYKISEILELCSRYNMYTVKPTVSVSNYPFSTVKKNLNSGNIISFNLNQETIKELPSIISYIKQKGYNLVLLEELINEKIMEEK